jgi:LuxR family maltose regulon positive regulatory protein
LIEEVLEQQPESVQAFLLQTAVLDRMTGSLCDAVRFGTAETPNRSEGAATSEGTAVRFGFSKSHIGQDNGQANLEILEHANLFIVALDEERCW